MVPHRLTRIRIAAQRRGGEQVLPAPLRTRLRVLTRERMRERDARLGAAPRYGTARCAAAAQAFLSDPEWIAVKKATAAKFGDLVEDVQDRQLQLTPYSPAPSTVP